MPETMRLLGDQRVEVTAIYSEEHAENLSKLKVEHDLYVLKSGTELALSLAGALDGLGAAILNPYLVATRCRDKIIATRILEAAGIPSPETFVASDPRQLVPLLEAGPIVVKPYRGSQGRGVRIARNPSDLQVPPPSGGPVFAQRYRQPKDRDYKLYRIGDDVFGVKRVWPALTYADKLGEPFAVSPELKDLALNSGSAFGIELCGVDVVMTDQGPWVVDVSSFPGFKGVPDAARRLADHIHAVAYRVVHGDVVAPSDYHADLCSHLATGTR